MFLIGPALLFRFSGAAVRSSAVPFSSLIGWSLCAVGAWMAAAAAGAFAPIGLALLAGLVLSLIDSHERRQPLWLVGDVIVVVVCGLISIPRPSVASLAVAGLAIAVAGGVLDQAARRLPGSLRTVAAILPLLAWVAYGQVVPEARAELLRNKGPELRAAAGMFFAAATAERGERIELDTGAVAWLTRPAGPPPYRGALFFHGSNHEGAYQRGGLFIRQALVGLGYAVLAVEQPGFGASPAPRPLDEVGSYDPRPSSIAAARYLESLPEVEGRTLIVGHSMGATSALRLLEEWLGASAGVIMGATLMPPEEENEVFYRAFIADYGLDLDEVSREFVLDVRSRYFNNDLAAARLHEGHAPVLFLRYAFEYTNIIEGRDELYEMIPGRKVNWELHTDHQMASSRLRGVMTGNWRVMRELRRGLGAFVEGISPVTGEPLRFSPR